MNIQKLTESQLEEKDAIDIVRTGTALIKRRELRHWRNELESDVIKRLREARNSGKPFELGLKDLLDA